MAFWSAQPRSAPASSGGGSSENGGGNATSAMDVLGRVVRTWASHGYDMPDLPTSVLQGEADRWLEHAMLGAPHPQRRPEGEQTTGATDAVREGARVAPAERDWRGLAIWFADRRRREGSYHTETVRDLRDGLWTLVSAAHTTLVESNETHRQAAGAVAELEDVLTGEAPIRTEELVARVRAIGDLLLRRREEQEEQLRSFARRVRRLQDELEAAQRLSAIDPLTGLANRMDFEETLAKTVAVQSLLRQPASLLVVDVDNFKDVNDRFGHQAGDQLLRQLAGQLVRVFPRSCDFLCRYAGDEFVVVLRDCSCEPAVQLAWKLVDAVRNMPAPAPDFDRPLTISVGVAELAFDDQGTSWLARADRALYAAKAAGRATVVALP